jgi:hypothetical protein
MPYNSRDPNAASGTSAWQLPVSRGFAVAVLVALVILFALRHVFGSITVAAGSS